MAKAATVKAEKYAQISAELMASMGGNITALFAAKQAADQAAKTAREAFEEAFTKALRDAGTAIPDDHKPLFGYFYGCAIGTDARGNMMFKPVAKAKAKTPDAANPIAALFGPKGANGTTKGHSRKAR